MGQRDLMRRLRTCLALGATASVAVLATAPAGAATTLSADRAVPRTCTDAQRDATGVATEVVRSAGVAMVSARLSDAAGNWDLAVFDADGDLVAGSAFAGGDEIAQGFTDSGKLTVQACRVSGSDPTARLQIKTSELTTPAPTMQLVEVATPTDADKDELVSMGLDLTEHGGPGFVGVVLHGPADGALLRERGFSYRVATADLLQASLADRAAERRIMRRGGGGGLPSGRTGTYRRLFDYSQEMQALAAQNPNLVRYFTLPYETYEGRPVEAIEVAPKVKRRDGRPVFLMMGVHHAREWPSSESTIEFAYELINGWKQKNKQIRRLLKRTRVIFIPVVNPDGFNTSREAGELAGAAGGRDAPAGDETANLVIPYEYHRKNCRFTPPLEDQGGNCMQQPALGLSQFGVDPNRNYGGFWGGPGASSADTVPFGFTAQDYRGPAPFSEPETQNVRWLVSRRQVVTLITNHTFTGLVLRPPGLQAKGPPPDEKVYKRLGDSMAAENGYVSQKGYELYDTSGTTEDWSYYATGGLGFTFEIGFTAFHPTYADAVEAEYLGTTEQSGSGSGNRAAYLKALKSTANPKRHSVLRGRAPKGAVLTLSKKFKTPTSPVLDGDGVEGDVILFQDRLRTTMKVGRKGIFRWHVNPSTRPLVDPRQKTVKPRKGQPSPPVDFGGDATGAQPCADFETEDPTCFNDHPFTVPGGEGIDNGTANVRVTWANPASDWDMKVFRDSDKDGSSEGETKIMGSSGSSPPGNVEETTPARPGLKRGKYVVRMINYAATDPYTGRITFGKTQGDGIKRKLERWVLTCQKGKNGPVLDRRRVLVKRGQGVKLDLRKACRA